MRTLGIDIGSRAIKVAWLEQDQTPVFRTCDTGWDPIASCEALIEDFQWDQMLVTGYGRHLSSDHWGCERVSEIRAVSRGAVHLAPVVRAIVDIGGQDTKAIALDERGRQKKFVMNDRCAAGTGRFLEVMATVLGLSGQAFAQSALSAESAATLSSMCAVFAESEVISLVGKGLPREQIALGVHRSVAAKALQLLDCVPVDGAVLFTGGCAHNPCLVAELSSDSKHSWVSVKEPQHVAALGCALLARER